MQGTAALYFQSLNRFNHILGVDRRWFFLAVGLCTPIAFAARFAPLMDAITAFLFLICHMVGVLMTRADDQMLVLYKRHIRYRKYYTATPGLHAPIAVVRPSVPVYQGQRGLV